MKAWVLQPWVMFPNEHVFSPRRHSVFLRRVRAGVSVPVCDGAAREALSVRVTSIRATPSSRSSRALGVACLFMLTKRNSLF